MAKPARAYSPQISDRAVLAATGKTWDQWFALLDKEGAAGLGHRDIVKLAARKGGAGPWWRQMVTVEYERTRGLRRKHETAGGFSVSVSKTFAADVAVLFAAVCEPARRRKWFPAGELKVLSQTKDKYFSAAWNGTARLEINFAVTPSGKAQIAVQLKKLTKNSDVERERVVWKGALISLQKRLSE